MDHQNITELIINGGIGLVGAIIGGIFTMWGVNKTLNRQYKEKFKEEFPLKIRNLDLIIEELSKIKRQETEYNYLFSELYRARQNNKPKSNDPTILNLIDTAIKIDGIVYKKIRKFIEKYMNHFEDATAIYDFGVVIREKDSLDRPVARLSDEAEAKVDKLVEVIKTELNVLLNFLKSHKENMENEYFDN